MFCAQKEAPADAAVSRRVNPAVNPERKIVHPVLIEGEWKQSDQPLGVFQAIDPSSGQTLADEYPISNALELERALQAGVEAAEMMFSIDSSLVVAFLRGYADRIETNAARLADIAHLETALPISPRLIEMEIPRTILQLRLAADAAEQESWREAKIDHEASIASCMGPLGAPVLVIGPSNFPFAYNGIAGGDFAAAIAAQNPVIAKAHPLHPSTTRLLGEFAAEAAADSGLPQSVVQLVYDVKPEDGLRLAGDRRLGALAFTGSRRAGLALKNAADDGGTPAYLEMSAVNPVFVLPGALTNHSEQLIDDYYNSCTLGVGQFCTSPGLLVLPKSDNTELVLNSIAQRFDGSDAGTMLAASLAANAVSVIEQLLSGGASFVSNDRRSEQTGAYFYPMLLRCTAKQFLSNTQTLQSEAFGPIGLAVVAEDIQQMITIARTLEGSLTATVYSDQDGSDDDDYKRIAPLLRARCGRLLNDKMPTGVTVSPAMNHGGPYPATGHPGFTAVGMPGAIRRFAALHCYDHVRTNRLPKCLRS
ncbi:MAG: aldehyde dehydrogenase family protein [Planctomycetota bacterium]